MKAKHAEAMKLALEALKQIDEAMPFPVAKLAQAALREALAEQPAQQQEPVAHAVIAGALFDFMGWLTSRKERLVLSSADNASPAVEAITEFAKMRGLSLNDAKVQDWNTSPPAQRKPLTDEEIDRLWSQSLADTEGETWLPLREFARAIEAKLKEKNTP